MKDIVLKAFLEVRNGKSADVVIADPEINAKFIDKCRRHHAKGSSFDFNQCLYNLRKLGGLADHPTTVRIRPKRQDEYRFASEIAARHLELRERTTLDRIVCDPSLAAEFDKLAAEIAPGFSALEYRLAALSLRKQSRLKPEIVSRIIKAVRVEVFRVADLDANKLPQSQGVYVLFYKNAGILYIGEAVNLRARLRKHLDHSDRKEVARWLWEFGAEGLHIEIHMLPQGTSALERKAVERELIASRHPRFNVLGTVTKDG